MTADETYIKIRGVKAFIWFIMNPKNRSIIGYRVSTERDVGACILAMRMAFRHFTKLPKDFRFIADGYSAYILAAQQFLREYGNDFKFKINDTLMDIAEYLKKNNFKLPEQIRERTSAFLAEMSGRNVVL